MKAKKQSSPKTPKQLLRKIKELRAELTSEKEVSGSSDPERAEGEPIPYSLLLENLGQGAASIDKNGTILFANEDLADILNLPLQKVIGSPLKKYVIPADWPRLAGLVQKAAKKISGKNFTFYVPGRRLVPVRISAAAGPQGIGLIVRDLSREKENEEILAEAQVSRAILLNARQIVVVCDAEGRILRTSTYTFHHCKSVLGRPFDEALPMKILRCGKVDRPFSIFEVLKGTRVFVNQEVLFQSSWGDFFMLLNARASSENKKVLGCVLILTDITDRKRAEERLQEAQTRLQADLDAMTTLQNLNAQSAHEENLDLVLAEIVDAAISISGADFGNIQLLDRDASDLTIMAQRGFSKPWVDYWNGIGKGLGSCGLALKRGERVIVEDVEQHPVFTGKPGLEVQLKAGVRACQSTMLVSRSGKTLGVLSTHYKRPYRPDDRILQLLDILSSQAADIIDRAQAEQALKRYRDELEDRVQERTAKLAESEERLRSLASELIKAQETERKRIAHELHDSLAAQLAAIKYRLERKLKGGESSDNRITLEEIIQDVQNANLETRRIMANLRPSVLDDLGIIPALSWFARETQKTYPGKTVEITQRVEERDIPEELKIVIFRVIQESVTNAARHGNAERILISLERRNGWLRASVNDNGKGFDSDKIGEKSENGGIGLDSMQQRVDSTGGIFSISSSPGQGTTVKAEWRIG